jgi:diketogulonate reductase-like aldo/keto reductase
VRLQEENADVFDFELSEEQMDKLNALDKGKAGACSWNPVDAA